MAKERRIQEILPHLVLADDASGALECASLLAGLSLDVVVCLGASPELAYENAFVVADTGSRHLTPAAAGDGIRNWLRHPHHRVFKKTDSTLRGNIAAELLALPAPCVIYVPAYPAVGRTVRGGCLFVHGMPLAETPFATDPRQPVRGSRVADLFPAGTRLHLAADAEDLGHLVRSGAEGILICDASVGSSCLSTASRS